MKSGSYPSKRTRQVVQVRLDRAALGSLGDVKSLGDGLLELRINYGPGLRIYCSIQGAKILLLLVGGDKKTQSDDIQKAKFFLKDWKKNGQN